MSTQHRFGPYEVGPELGAGGMGAVYRATDVRVPRSVALKILHPAFAADPQYRERFRRESAMLSAAEHPHIVPVYNFGEIDGRLYLDMRLIDGEDLGAFLAHGSPLNPRRAQAFVEGLADALDFVHQRGVMHRDIKPKNIMLAGARMFPYLLDFGIAHASGEAGLTSVNMVVGSLEYLAPERFNGAPADRRSDIYAFAGVLLAALTGEPPYPGQTEFHAAFRAHCYEPVPKASRADPKLAPLDAVIARGMAKDPDDRYATAGELAEAAVAALERIQIAESAPLITVPLEGGSADDGWSPATTTAAGLRTADAKPAETMIGSWTSPDDIDTTNPRGQTPPARISPPAVQRPIPPPVERGPWAPQVAPGPAAASAVPPPRAPAGSLPGARPRELPIGLRVGLAAGALATAVAMTLALFLHLYAHFRVSIAGTSDPRSIAIDLPPCVLALLAGALFLSGRRVLGYAAGVMTAVAIYCVAFWLETNGLIQRIGSGPAYKFGVAAMIMSVAVAVVAIVVGWRHSRRAAPPLGFVAATAPILVGLAVGIVAYRVVPNTRGLQAWHADRWSLGYVLLSFVTTVSAVYVIGRWQVAVGAVLTLTLYTGIADLTGITYPHPGAYAYVLLLSDVVLIAGAILALLRMRRTGRRPAQPLDSIAAGRGPA